MQLKFLGDYGKLKRCVSRTEIDGGWRDLKYGQKQYRTNDGGYLELVGRDWDHNISRF